MTLLDVVQSDITTVGHDAIVNAANNALAGGDGVDGAIHRAGGPRILAECQQWVETHGPLPTGQAMATTAGDIPSRFIIHTVGPIWNENQRPECERLLGECYRNSLTLAQDNACQSVAIPNISTGVYGYPKEQAGEVAVATTRDWLQNSSRLERVTFVCFNEDNLAIYEELLGS